MVRVGLRDLTGGSRRWYRDYAPVPFQAPDRGPNGGGPPGGPGGQIPGGGGPPSMDEAWQRHEAVVGPDHVVVRDAQELRAFAISDGRPVWFKTSPTPVSALELIGDTVIVASDKLSAYALSSGQSRWQLDLRGARVVGTQDGKAMILVAEGTVIAVELSGRVLWQTKLPVEYTNTVVDRMFAGTDAVYLTVRSREDRSQPLDADVVAISLT